MGWGTRLQRSQQEVGDGMIGIQVVGRIKRGEALGHGHSSHHERRVVPASPGPRGRPRRRTRRPAGPDYPGRCGRLGPLPAGPTPIGCARIQGRRAPWPSEAFEGFSWRVSAGKSAAIGISRKSACNRHVFRNRLVLPRCQVVILIDVPLTCRLSLHKEHREILKKVATAWPMLDMPAPTHQSPLNCGVFRLPSPLRFVGGQTSTVQCNPAGSRCARIITSTDLHGAGWCPVLP